MPKLNDQELSRVRNESDMIQGDINRMCTASTRGEAYSMFMFGVRRMLRILDCVEDAFDREEAQHEN